MLKKKWKTTSSKQNSKQTSWLWWEGAWRLGLLLIGKGWCRRKAWVHRVLHGGGWDPPGPCLNLLKPETEEAFELYGKLLWWLVNYSVHQCSPEGFAIPTYPFSSPWWHPQYSTAQRGKPICQLKGHISGSRKKKKRQIPQLWGLTLLAACAYLAYSYSHDLNLCLLKWKWITCLAADKRSYWFLNLYAMLLDAC